MTRQEAGVKRRGKIDPGSVFGKWTVLEEFMAKRRSCRCQCECGTIRVMPSSDLTRLDHPTRSCGCNGSTYSHGKARRGKKTKEYIAWVAINARCHCETNPAWHNYGGRGIKVCERWRDSFENFLSDMGSCPSPKHSIDRFPDNNGNYEPGNCRWATAKEQSRNTRRTIYFSHCGESKPLLDWCDINNMPISLVMSRCYRGERDYKKVFREKDTSRMPKRIVINNEIDSIRGWCKRLSIDRNSVTRKIRLGSTAIEAILSISGKVNV